MNQTTALVVSIDRTDEGIMKLASGKAWKGLNKVYSRSANPKVKDMQDFIVSNGEIGDLDGEDIAQVVGLRLFQLRDWGLLTDWYSLNVHTRWLYKAVNHEVYRHRRGYEETTANPSGLVTDTGYDEIGFSRVEVETMYNQVVGLLRNNLKHNANVHNHIVTFYRCLIGGEDEAQVAQDLGVSPQAVNKYVGNIRRCILKYGREIAESCLCC